MSNPCPDEVEHDPGFDLEIEVDRGLSRNVAPCNISVQEGVGSYPLVRESSLEVRDLKTTLFLHQHNVGF